MNESLWTFFFEIANFLLLAAGLAWVFFKPVRAALEAEQSRRREVEAEAKQKLSDAKKLLSEAQAERKQLASELETKRTEALEATQAEAQQMLGEARARLREEREQARRDALHLEQSEQAKIYGAIAAAARQTLEQLMEQVDGPELEAALVSTASRELKKLLAQNPRRIVVESAEPLSHECEKRIRDATAEATQEATPRFVVRPELQGGLRISTDIGLIDASMQGLLKFAERSFDQELKQLVGENHSDA